MTTKQEVSMLELVFMFGSLVMGGVVAEMLFCDLKQVSSNLKMENFCLKLANSKLEAENSRLKENLEECDSDN